MLHIIGVTILNNLTQIVWLILKCIHIREKHDKWFLVFMLIKNFHIIQQWTM